MPWVVCLAALGAVMLNGCAAPRRPPPVAAHPAQPPDPFDDTATSFTVQGARFAPGETAIVKVCVTPEGSIASADVVGSSGDKRFDDYALVWARQVRLRSVPRRCDRHRSRPPRRNHPAGRYAWRSGPPRCPGCYRSIPAP